MKQIKSGLDLNNFEVIDLILKKYPVVFMKDKRPESKLKWCIQYKGSGHYFETYNELLDYYNQNLRRKH